ncbi:LysR family transcriptional regulator [Roseibium sp. AS2]|uniref:LysR family transcriptional regulator n=1 Tax=Roseibium sp. AS2 TaxID=3135781 RepID=UPI003171A9B5
MKNNPSPDQLSIFLMVLREGGFRAAARRLGVAPSKVSTTVSRIEAQMGVPLILRTTRSIRATNQGSALADRIAPLLSEIEAACVETAQTSERVRGKLKLNVPGAVMPDILPPILGAYRSAYPEVEVEIVVDNDFVDIIAAGCDAGIRYGSRLEKDMISIPIGPRVQKIALAASPAYLQERGHPRKPADLTRHDAIRYRLSEGPCLPWILNDGGKRVTVEPVTRLTISVNALNTGLSCARAGLGIIGTFHNWLEDDFQTGKLVPILQDCWPTQEGPRLYYPSRFASAPLRAFIAICSR